MMNHESRLFIFFSLLIVISQANLLRVMPRSRQSVRSLSSRIATRATTTTGDDGCDCGYYIPETGLTFTHHLSLNPSTLLSSNLAGSLNKQGWYISNYTIASSPKKINYTPRNVRLNPTAKTLDFWVSGGSKSRTLIDSAELNSIVDDIRYGSFRFTAKASKVPGTCHGLFFYKDDHQEIDIEILTSHISGANSPDEGQPRNGLQLSVQPLSDEQVTPNYRVVPFKTSSSSKSVFDPTAGYHEYRFDWTRTSVKYFVDGYLDNIYWKNLPTDPGSVLINNWSNGDIYWPSGPPTSDNILSIKKVDVYFNVTNTAQQLAWKNKCKASTRKQVCGVEKSSSS